MAPDDDDWRKDELKCVNVCLCVGMCVRNRQTDKEARQPPTEAVGIPEEGIIFFGGVLFLTQNFIVCW